MRDPILVRALVVSKSASTVDFLRMQMQQLAIHMDTCLDARAAGQCLCRGKFEGVIVDLEFGEEGLQLLEGVREMTSHRHAISYAIVENEDQANGAFRSHANFVLRRPLSAAAVLRTLRAAYPMMFRERRRCYRHAIEVPTLVRRETGEEFWAMSLNISETGVAISSSVKVGVGEQIRLRIELPGVSDPVVAAGDICWNHDGRVGMRFVNAPDSALERLHTWLSDQMAELAPGW